MGHQNPIEEIQGTGDSLAPIAMSCIQASTTLERKVPDLACCCFAACHEGSRFGLQGKADGFRSPLP